jgi:hypothetical protein
MIQSMDKCNKSNGDQKVNLACHFSLLDVHKFVSQSAKPKFLLNFQALEYLQTNDKEELTQNVVVVKVGNRDDVND